MTDILKYYLIFDELNLEKIKMETLLQFYFWNIIIIKFHNPLYYKIKLIILMVYLYQYSQIIILDFTFILFIIIYTTI